MNASLDFKVEYGMKYSKRRKLLFSICILSQAFRYNTPHTHVYNIYNLQKPNDEVILREMNIFTSFIFPVLLYFANKTCASKRFHF